MFYDRFSGAKARGAKSGTKIFPAPVRGWIRNESLATSKPGGAEVLDNWFPTAEGARMRKGSTKHATLDGSVTHLTTYDNTTTSQFIAADGTGIYNITTVADPDTAVTADVTGQTSGDYSSVQFATSGGEFLVMVNGADYMQQYDGTDWLTVNASSTPRSITGIDTSALSQVWKFANRLWFIEANTTSAWYLPSLSVGGAATEFPLGGVFNLGGSLIFGATWSLDAGDGLDDVCLFFSDKGEVAVYQGSDPSSTFEKVGVYRIGVPLHKNAWFKAGGDLAVMTDDGIVPISSAVKKDRAALAGSAITYPIEQAWRDIINERNGAAYPFSCVLWQSETMLVVGIPTFSGLPALCFVANARTGAWARYTGWDTRCVQVYNDRLFFGTADGTVIRGEVQGSDQGVNYTACLVPRFDSMNSAAEKSAIHARIVARANDVFTAQLFANADYEVNLPTPLNADAAENTNTWGSGVWGTSVWGGSGIVKQRLSSWENVAATGQALAPGLQITSGRATAPDIELIALHLQYEMGQVMG